VEYLNVLRVNRAQRLLLSTDLGIAEIAGLVGFSSVQTFNRVFKQQSRLLSPSEYRKYKAKK
jgi:transcriptional regulator GlxA family with amidase domain